MYFKFGRIAMKNDYFSDFFGLQVRRDLGMTLTLTLTLKVVRSRRDLCNKKKDHRSITYRYGDTHARSLGAILKSSKTLKARNSLTAADTLVKLYSSSLGSSRSFI